MNALKTFVSGLLCGAAMFVPMAIGLLSKAGAL
ncbi:hypothetical protein SAMN06265795_12626 [Noviherbaspirillum humi]|uniref:Uncharacterized protein n=1 Tax=Noviherbaspirillum humi TaxID=1688639 RepID=A0A239LU54_9BURK|nr:hypothetical protein SAMN06265795_12626 [Noviherbaspirillum humi]